MINLNEVECADEMFYRATFKSIAGFVNTKNIKSAKSMFYSCTVMKSGLSGLDLSQLTSAERMFHVCTLGEPLEPATLKSFKRVVNGEGMFKASNGVLPLVLKKSDFDFSSLHNASSMFSDTLIEQIEDFESDSIVIGDFIFNSTRALKSVGSVKLTNCQSCKSMFGYSRNLKEVGEVLIPQATGITGIFKDCSSLEAIGTIDISNTRNGSVEAAFSGTSDLEIICNPIWPSRLPNYRHHMFYKSLLGKVYGRDGDKLNSVLQAQDAIR